MQIRNFSAVALGWAFVLLSSASSAFQISESFDDDKTGEFCGTFWYMSWNSTVSTENSATGGKSCKMAISQGGNGWGGGVSLQTHGYRLPKGEELWVRWRMFMPTGFDYGVYSAGDTLKFVRLEMKEGNQNANFELELKREGSSTPLGIYVSKNPCDSYADCWDFFGKTSGQPSKGVWETWEMYIKIDDRSVEEGGTGKTLMWKNGKLMGELTKHNTINDPNDKIATVRFFTYWNGGAPRTQHLYFDDLVITNERPASVDSQGNAYIGMGEFVAGEPSVKISPPNPPIIQ